MKPTAVSRAKWFAQLADAIESAQRLAWQLGMQEQTSIEARELYNRLEAVRHELDSLRGLMNESVFNIEPDWIRKLGWGSPLADRAD